MASLLTACLTGDIPAEPALVVSPVAESAAVRRAASLGVPVAVVKPGDGYGERLFHVLQQNGIGCLCLAGYMFHLPKAVVDAYPSRILNIHPALLPKFGGKGMYGIHVHRAVLAAGERESGCSVHFVTENYDEGAVVLQMKCPVLPNDTPDTLADRVLDLEVVAYPRALKEVVLGLSRGS